MRVNIATDTIWRGVPTQQLEELSLRHQIHWKEGIMQDESHTYVFYDSHKGEMLLKNSVHFSFCSFIGSHHIKAIFYHIVE